ncbi:heterokaryon incompatibility protein-domain-containing protein [Trametes gibbosa]|nr:heterokaryon incompatibility protein-domain-containing protein [Trametes gibbosa]
MASRRSRRKHGGDSRAVAVRPLKLPRKPPSICRACWKGPFAAQLGLFGERIEREDGEYGTYLGDLNLSGGHSYSTRWAALEFRARNGCSWCQLLSALVHASRDLKLTSDTQLRIVVGIESIHLPVEYTPKGAQILSVHVNGLNYLTGHVYADADDPAAAHIVARTPMLGVKSPRALALAKACADECLLQHEHCREISASPAPLPTRVLDCAEPHHPRLVTTKGRRGVYVALSYVWGEDQPHRTTMANISSYAKGIDLASLPQTIRDSIHVTHALGIAYLWIDSLCIIQDSDVDKQHEIMLMRLIYRNAHLTIIAASARKVSEGFLQDRPVVPHVNGTRVPISLPFICPPSPIAPGGNVDGTATAREVGTVHIAPDFQATQVYPLYDRAWEPITARGWCMQEYFVSPRALIFASHTLQFRCQKTTQNIGGAFHSLDDDARLPAVLFLADPPRVPRSSALSVALRQAWIDIVGDYTARVVTVSADKLVAFGAVAEMFQRVLRSDYLAALWRDTFLVDLCWNRREERSQRPRPPAYRAPSWSWAAVEGEVVVSGTPLVEREGTVAEIVECTVVLEDAQLPFERVAGGALVLHAPVLRCAWYAVDERDNVHYRVLLQTARDARMEGAREDPDEEEGEFEAANTGESIYAIVDSTEDAERAMDDDMWAVILFQNDRLLEGLVIVRTDPAGSLPVRPETSQVYRRVGFFGVENQIDVHALGWDDLPLGEIVLV